MKRLLLALCCVPLLASAGNSPEATVQTLWRSLSHEANAGGDAASLRRIFHPDAVVLGGRYNNGQPVFSIRKATDFIAAVGTARPAAFHECEVHRDVKQYDRFATVFSVVESRADKSTPKADFVGVNSIELYKQGDEWTIVALYYHVEKPGLPVPLGSGKPGACLVN